MSDRRTPAKKPSREKREDNTQELEATDLDVDEAELIPPPPPPPPRAKSKIPPPPPTPLPAPNVAALRSPPPPPVPRSDALTVPGRRVKPKLQVVDEIEEIDEIDITIQDDDGPVSKPHFSPSVVIEALVAELPHTEEDRHRRARLLWLLGTLEEEQRRDPTEAKARYRAALKADPSSLPSLQSLRRLEARRGNTSEAIKLLEQEISLTRDDLERAAICVELGRLLELRGESERAVAAYRRALEVDQGSRDAIEALISLHFAQGQWVSLSELLLRAAATTEDPVRRALFTSHAAVVREVKLEQDGPAEALLTTALRQCPRTDGRSRAAPGGSFGGPTDEIEITIEAETSPEAQANLESSAPGKGGSDAAAKLSPGEPLGVLGPVAAELARLYRNRKRWAELAQLERTEAQHTDTAAMKALHLYQAGRLFADMSRDPSSAEDCFEAAAALQNEDVLSLRALAELRQRRGDASAMEMTLVQLLPRQRSREHQVATRFEIARLRHERLNQTEKAIEALNEALEQDPNHVPSLRALEDILVELGRFEDLVDVARTEVDRLHDHTARADAYYELGQLVERHLATPDRAAFLYRTALDLAAGHAAALEALDRLYTEQENWEPLVDLLEIAAETTNDQRRAGSRLARAAQLAEHRLEDPQRALALTDKLLAIRPDDLDAISAFGRLLERMGRWEERLRVLRQEVELSTFDPERLALLMSIGTICEVRLSAPRRARDVYREVVARDPSHRAALRALARLDRRAGHFENLLATLDLELGDLTGRDAAVVHYRKGRLLEDRLGKPEEALTCYRAALSESVGFQPAIDGLDRLLRQLERWADLAELLEEEANRGEDLIHRAVTWQQLGELYETRLDDVEGAWKAFLEASRLAPGFEIARSGALRILEGLNRWKDVADVLSDDAARTTGRQRLISLMRLASVRAWRLSQPREAIDALDKASEIAPWDMAVQDAMIHASRGQAQWERLGNSYRALSKILTDPRDAAALLHRAALEAHHSPAVGDQVAIYQQILELVPNDSGALAALESIALGTGDEHLLAEVTSRLLSVETRESKRVPLLVRQGALKSAAGDELGAAQAFKRALDIDSTCLPAIRGLEALASAAGRYEELAELKEQEAISLLDPVGRIAALMDAGEIRLGTLAQKELAAQCFAAVLEIEPGQARAFQRLSGILEAAGRWADLAHAIRTRLGTSPKKSEEVNLRLRLCLIERDKLGTLETALHTLEGLLTIEPENRNALENLGEILASLERWREAAAAYETAIDAAASRSERNAQHRCQLALAEIQLFRLGEFDQAVETLSGALAREANDMQALKLMAEAERRRGNPREVASALDDLAQSSAPGERAAIYLELAEILTNQLDDWTGGADSLEKAVGDAPSHPEPLQRLREHYASRGDWEGLARGLASIVDEVSGEATEADMVRVELANTLIERLGRVAAGTEHLEAILRVVPAHPEARFAMARRHLRPPGRPDLAEQQYRTVLAEDPWNIEALRGLFRLLATGQNPARSRFVAMLLAYLGDQDAQASAQPTSIPGRRPLGPDGYQHWVAHPAEPAVAAQVLRMVQNSLYKVLPPDLERHGASREDRKTPPDPLALSVEEVAHLLGLEQWETYVSHRSRHVCAVEPGDPPKVIVGVGLQSYQMQRRRFELGRVLGSVLGGSLLFSKAPRREIPVLFSAVIGAVVKGYAALGDPGEVADLTKRVARALPRKIRKQIEDHARAIAGIEPPDIEGWLAGSAISADRCGLLACADIAAALNAVRSREQERAPQPHESLEQRLAAIRGCEPAETLAKFWLSTACEEAISQIGTV